VRRWFGIRRLYEASFRDRLLLALVIGILIGTAILQVLQNLVNLLGIPSSLNFAVVGAVILLGVIADEVIKRRSARVKVAPGAAPS